VWIPRVPESAYWPSAISPTTKDPEASHPCGAGAAVSRCEPASARAAAELSWSLAWPPAWLLALGERVWLRPWLAAAPLLREREGQGEVPIRENRRRDPRGSAVDYRSADPGPARKTALGPHQAAASCSLHARRRTRASWGRRRFFRRASRRGGEPHRDPWEGRRGGERHRDPWEGRRGGERHRGPWEGRWGGGPHPSRSAGQKGVGLPRGLPANCLAVELLRAAPADQKGVEPSRGPRGGRWVVEPSRARPEDLTRKAAQGVLPGRRSCKTSTRGRRHLVECQRRLAGP